jgi:hypothetical protein
MTTKVSVFGRNIEFMNMKFTYLISWVDKNNLTAMQKVFLILFGLLFSISLLQAQSVDDLESFGFIKIKTDSMNVSFFIDGYYVGNHPLGGPVPVLPGFHEVSYIPPNIQNEKIRNNLSDGIKRVYVAENDTLEVFLFYDHYLTQIETMENELKIQNYVGFSLIGVLIFVILSIF